jgi:hypothetical protein
MCEHEDNPESVTLRHLHALDGNLDQMSKDIKHGFETVLDHLAGLTARITELEIRHGRYKRVVGGHYAPVGADRPQSLSLWALNHEHALRYRLRRLACAVCRP